MKLEIELDLNKIDYDAINKQIRDKIEKIDIEKVYQINSKVDNYVEDIIQSKINYYLGASYYPLNSDSEKQIKDEFKRVLENTITEHVEKIFDQIPDEEINQLIQDLLPSIFVDVVSKRINNSLDRYQNNSYTMIYNICNNKVQEMLNRCRY